jgi:predicted transposase/invertase (TIGR01784 family)
MMKSAQEVHEIPPQTPKEIQEAYNILEKHRWTRGETYAYERAIMAQMDDIEVMESAMIKRLEKGLEEGEQDRNIEIVKDLLTRGYTVDELAQITGLSTDDINSL